MSERVDAPYDRMSASALAARRAIHAEAIALRARATIAVARAAVVAACTDDVLGRSRRLCAAVWDGQLARWSARGDRRTPRGRRGGGAGARRAHGARVSRPAREAAAHSAPDPQSHRVSRAHVWANAVVLGERRVVDAVGESFVIRELDAQGVPGPHPARCLVFENNCLVRRVWDYPDDWRALSRAGLLALAGLVG